MPSRTGIGTVRTTRNLDRWLLIFLILIAFGRGAWALGGKSLWWDESLSLHRARGTLGYLLSNTIVLTDTIYNVDTIDNHPPLYFLLLWGTVRLLGETEFALRFPSLAFAVLLVPLLFATGRRLVDRWAGLGAAALAALSPMYLWYAQEARMYTLLAFLSLLSFYFFVRTFFGPSGLTDLRRRWRWVIAYVLVTLCLVLTHHLSSLLIGFQLLVLGLALLRGARRHRALMVIVAGVASVVVASGVYALVTLPRPKGGAGYRFVPLWVILRDVWNASSLGLSVDVGDWYVLLIDLVFLLFLILGFVRLVRPGASPRWRTSGWLLAGYLLLPIGAIYGVSFFQPAYMNIRHLILITPAFYLLLASGLTMWRRQWAVVALLGWLLVIGGMAYSTYNYYYDPAYDKDHHREWGAYLREHVRPGDIVVVDPPHIAELYDYYADSGVPWVGLPLLSGSTQETVDKLEELLQNYDRVWLAVSHTPPWGDRRHLPQTWLNENAFRVAFKGFESYASNVEAAAYLRDWPSIPELPHDGQLLQVRYNPALRLEGYRIISSPESGQVLHVELFWGTDELGPEQVSVVLRLVDSEGRLWGQGEQCPFNGLYPMWQWQPDLLLRDEHELSIWPGTPPGTYELEVALVSQPDGCAGGGGRSISPTMAPLNVLRGDRVLLGTVEVQAPEDPPSLDDLGLERRHRARFDGLALLGSNLAARESKLGERLDVTLAWEALRAPLSDTQFRLRLTDSSGQVRQEDLIRPAGIRYPTDRWLAGDRYVGRFWLTLPEDAPAGRYRVELLPEPPLQQGGAWATLRRTLSGSPVPLKLGEVDVAEQFVSPTLVPPAAIPLPTDLVVSNPMVASLGDRIRFLGYDLELDQVQAGEPLQFTLYWQALNSMNVSYSVFTHLLGPSNEIVGQKDGIPQDGAYPTTLWQPGEVVVDTYSFVVNDNTPAGEYPLEVGMYRTDDGTRLPVADENGQPVPQDRLLLGPITVLSGND